MAVTPIDLQVNAGQMLEVNKGEKAREMAVTGMQKTLDEEAAKEALIKNTKTEALRKSDQTGVNDVLVDEEKPEQQQQRETAGKEENSKKRKLETAYDDRRGTKIDFLK